MAEKKASDGPKKAPSPKKKPAAKSSITLWELKKQIDERAHQIYLDRISAHKQGDELSDWLLAESEIKKKHKL
ncbi:MAG TPA: hypothetical protein VMW69_01735 [Spirochaetia bacterium]|nr:hypothetical protein [Spirochaetia bacterium]